MTEPEHPKTYDVSVGDLAKALINAIIKDSQDTYGDTTLDKVRHHLQFQSSEPSLNSIAALSAYMQAKAAERQATAMESIAKTASKLQMADATDVAGQAIIDAREPKREYLASTYSLPTETLSLLWAIRGILMDASVRSLSKPDRFDPYRRLSTEEVAWSLRTTKEVFWERLPRTSTGAIDFPLLEDFDVLHYSGSDEFPEDWVFGG